MENLIGLSRSDLIEPEALRAEWPDGSSDPKGCARPPGLRPGEVGRGKLKEIKDMRYNGIWFLF